MLGIFLETSPMFTTIRSLASALLLVLLAGSSAHAEKLVLTVASFPDLDRAAKAATAAWSRLHPDIELRIVSRQYADHHTAMTTALATGSGLPDVMAVDMRFIGKFADSGGLEDLRAAPYDGMALRARFAPYTFPQAIGHGGALVAIPADIGPGTLLYRKDLADKAGVTEADLTRDWESYIAAGRKIKAATGTYLLADAGDLRDIALRSGLKDGEGIYFDGAGRCLVESPRFVRAFELGREVRQAGLDAKATAWSNEWAADFKQGRIASQMMGAWLTGHLKNWLAPDNAGRWRSAALPGGLYASYGGSFYAIPAKADHKQAAWEFIRFMTTNKEIQLNSLRALDSFPALNEALQDRVMDEPVAYLGGQKARLLWRDIAAHVPSIAVNRLDATATDVIRDEFEKVVSEGKAIPVALADARELIEHRARRR